jgi:hypothetical protein
MSGSTATVLLRSRLTEVQHGQLEDFVRQASGSENLKEFWLLGQPFTIDVSLPDEEDPPPAVPEWTTAQASLVICHARGQSGDVLVAFVAGRLAEMFSGLISLGCRLDTLTSNPSVLTLEGRYASEDGDVLTPGCLNYWASMLDFRMCN